MSEEETSGKDWFGNMDLGAKYAIVLGALIFVTVLAACCKLLYVRYRTRKILKQQDIAKSEAKEELHVLTKREEDEGDLFGIRALERGFYGGVAQSRPSTPVSLGGASTLVAHPLSAHTTNSRPGSSNGPKPHHQKHVPPAISIGHYSPGPTNQTPDSQVDMHLTVPPSPTHPRLRDEPQSPVNSTSTAPHLNLGFPSSGLGIRTYSSSSSTSQNNNHRPEVTPPSPVVTHQHVSGMYSDASSINSPSHSRGGSASSSGDYDRYRQPSVPHINIQTDDSQYYQSNSSNNDDSHYYSSVPMPIHQPKMQKTIAQLSELRNTNRAALEPSSNPYVPYGSSSNHSYHHHQYQNQSHLLPHASSSSNNITNNNTSNSNNDCNHNHINNRVSTASVTEFYDSYFDNRVSMSQQPQHNDDQQHYSGEWPPVGEQSPYLYASTIR